MNGNRVWLISGLVLVLILTAGIYFLSSQSASDTSLSSALPGEFLEACTVVMVGKEASTDGSIFTTHTCDCGTCDWTFSLESLTRLTMSRALSVEMPC